MPMKRCLNAPRCDNRVRGGYCDRCAREREQERRRTGASPYGARWRRFAAAFYARLVEAGVAPVCGARLPATPATFDSLCAAESLLVFEDLDVDHIHPHEGENDARMWDVRNLQLLCHGRCHARKTVTKDGGFGRRVIRGERADSRNTSPGTPRDLSSHAVQSKDFGMSGGDR